MNLKSSYKGMDSHTIIDAIVVDNRIVETCLNTSQPCIGLKLGFFFLTLFCEDN